MTDSLYFIENEDGTIKIGRAKDVRRRLQHLQTSLPGQLRVIGIVTDAGDLEKTVHAQFQHLRIRGEWFRPDQALHGWISEHNNADLNDLQRRPQAAFECIDTRVARERIDRMVKAWITRRGGTRRAAMEAIAGLLGWPKGSLENLFRNRTVGLLAREVRDVGDTYAAFLDAEIERLQLEMVALRDAGKLDDVTLEECVDTLRHARELMANIRQRALSREPI